MRLRLLTSAHLLAAVSVTLLIAACGSSSNTHTGGSALHSSNASSSGPIDSSAAPGAVSSGLHTVSSVADLVPASLRGKTLQLATDANGNAPGEFINAKTGAMEGSDIDLGYDLCKVMGVVCHWNQVDFDSLIVQLQAGRYAFSLAGMTPRPAREKSVDFITYFKDGELWMEKAQGGPTVTSAVDMCGRTVAVQTGIIEEQDAWGFMGKKVGGGTIPGAVNHCKAAGRPNITVLSFPSEPDADATLLSGRSQLVWTDADVADWVSRQSHGQLKTAGSSCDVGRYGIALHKHSDLEPAISAALRYIINNGDYGKVLHKWGDESGAITASQVDLNNNNTIGGTCVPQY